MGESAKYCSNAAVTDLSITQRESFASDFTTGWSAALSQNFYKFTWGETHDNVPYAIQYTDANVYGYNDGLGLKTSAFPAGSAGPVKTAGIGTLRSDILYGSFRMRATVPTVSTSITPKIGSSAQILDRVIRYRVYASDFSRIRLILRKLT